jgi:hypothetical protein
MRLALLVMLVPTLASAETQPPGNPAAIEVDRADTPPGRTELGFDGGAPLPSWGVSLAGQWLSAPMTLGSTEPVAHRQSALLGAAVAIGNSLVLDTRLAFSTQTGDRLAAYDDVNELDGFVIGDVGLGARIRVAGTDRRAVFGRGDVSFPSGDDHDFAGESSYTLAWRLIGRVTLPAEVVIAGSLGFRLRGDEVRVSDKLMSDELTYAVGAVVPLPPLPRVWCEQQAFVTAELTGIVGNDVGSGTGPSPIEARIGVLSRPRPAWAIAARIGHGLTDEIGSPSLRATLEVSFTPGATPVPPVSTRL